MKQECADLVDKMDCRSHCSVFSTVTHAVTNIGIMLHFSIILAILYQAILCDLVHMRVSKSLLLLYHTVVTGRQR